MQQELIEMLDKMVKYFDELPSDSYYYRETVAILDEAEKLVEKAKKSAKEPAVPDADELESALERLVERCNTDQFLSNDDAVIHAEATLERVYKSRKSTDTPAAPSQPVTLTDGLIEKGAMTGMVDAQIDAIIAALREKEFKQ